MEWRWIEQLINYHTEGIVSICVFDALLLIFPFVPMDLTGILESDVLGIEVSHTQGNRVSCRLDIYPAQLLNLAAPAGVSAIGHFDSSLL
jgi:hypothetical protein